MVKNMVKDSSITEFTKTLNVRLNVRIGRWPMVNGHPGHLDTRRSGHQAPFVLKL